VQPLLDGDLRCAHRRACAASFILCRASASSILFRASVQQAPFYPGLQYSKLHSIQGFSTVSFILCRASVQQASFYAGLQYRETLAKRTAGPVWRFSSQALRQSADPGDGCTRCALGFFCGRSPLASAPDQNGSVSEYRSVVVYFSPRLLCLLISCSGNLDHTNELRPSDASVLLVQTGPNLSCGRFRSRTPGPLPFSSMNSMPADSSAFVSATIVDMCAAIIPGFDSSRHFG
jgi:hypothetical protein